MGVCGSVEFFGTRADLVAMFTAAEAKTQVWYVPEGLFPEAPTERYLTALQFPSLGLANMDKGRSEPRYLVLPSADALHLRVVPQRRGGVRFAADVLGNPGSISVKPGGVYGDWAMVPGAIMWGHGHEKSRTLFQIYARVIKEQFVCLRRHYWVGPGALALLREGYCLTSDVRLPREYCLSEE
jgi:hypothetical protein